MGSAVTSAARRPSVERPSPTCGRRDVRRLAAFSSTASANSVVSATPRRRASASGAYLLARDVLFFDPHRHIAVGVADQGK